MVIYLQKFWRQNSLLIIVLIIRQLVQVFIALMTAQMLNNLIQFDLDAFTITIGYIMCLWIIIIALMYLTIVYKAKVEQKMSTAIRMDIVKQLECTSYSEFHVNKTGVYSSWLNNDISLIETQGFENFYSLVSGISGIIFSVIALFSYHWSLVILTFFLSFLMLLIPKIFRRSMDKASLKLTRENENFLSKVTDVLEGFDTLLAMNLERKMTNEIEQVAQKLASRKITQAKITARVACVGGLGNIMSQLLTVSLTGFLAVQKVISIGAINATSNLASTVYNTLGELSSSIAAIHATKPIFNKFNEIKVTRKTSGRTIDQLEQGYIIRQLSYNYNQQPILYNINMSFELGKKYAIIGASGSGKSTLLNILAGKLKNYYGSIKLNGVDLNHLTDSTIRDYVLYIDQLPYIFDGTIYDNITLGESFSDEQLEHALKMSGLWESIQSLPMKVDTPVGESGRLFSGGQRQRIALARGFIRNKHIVLLDEGTASLDKKSAISIEENLVNNPNITVIMVSHNLHDRIASKLNQIYQMNPEDIKNNSMHSEKKDNATQSE
ncbi:ABC transporter ATP-binding protein/permease [Sporolactobacillus shoreicorticis]|uniref:ABC transporter ATP-binding protein n=1 Tax=Sporolactobacillus shoreicorticis TaxID=1923877 RepID=A0ABW5S4X0_9BACL|nr:ABC transporter ATP-binding protein [Sporolactobacillus shoreicorticis]MCO7127355.1 ABC transporter ATP-binding protein/permease [Sporolactobacillus shoreicorticis]